MTPFEKRLRARNTTLRNIHGFLRPSVPEKKPFRGRFDMARQGPPIQSGAECRFYNDLPSLEPHEQIQIIERAYFAG